MTTNHTCTPSCHLDDGSTVPNLYDCAATRAVKRERRRAYFANKKRR